MIIFCLLFGHKERRFDGPPPGSSYPRNWRVNWHIRCTRCGATS